MEFLKGPFGSFFIGITGVFVYRVLVEFCWLLACLFAMGGAGISADWNNMGVGDGVIMGVGFGYNRKGFGLLGLGYRRMGCLGGYAIVAKGLVCWGWDIIARV